VHRKEAILPFINFSPTPTFSDADSEHVKIFTLRGEKQDNQTYTFNFFSQPTYRFWRGALQHTMLSY